MPYWRTVWFNSNMKEKIIIPSKKFRSRRLKNKIRRIVSDVSFGVLNKICDLVVLHAILSEELLLSGGLYGKAMGRFRYRAMNYSGIDTKQWLEGIRNAQRKHWLDGSRQLIKEGEARLKSLFPKLYSEKHWDKNWYIVNFDIPEKNLRKKRDILREKLRTLGFGMLQQSIWISPTAFLGTIQKEVEELNLTPYVICSQTQSLGEENSRGLAERVWKLKDINREYQSFILEYEKGIKKDKFVQMFFKFMNIFQNDPQLPRELLPKNWVGQEAYELLKDFYIKCGVKGRGLKFFFGD